MGSFFFFILYFLAALGLFAVHRLSVLEPAGATLCCGKQGPLFIVVCGLLIVVASLVAERGL